MLEAGTLRRMVALMMRLPMMKLPVVIVEDVTWNRKLKTMEQHLDDVTCRAVQRMCNLPSWSMLLRM